MKLLETEERPERFEWDGDNWNEITEVALNPDAFCHPDFSAK
jgi:hypothetical protein